MPNKNKNKGKRGEAEICKMLESVFNLSFMRVFTSGSFFGGKNIKRFDKYTKQQQDLNEGDIVVPEELSHFSIEVKNYKDFAFHSLFSGKCSILDKWIEQASQTKKPFWLLFFKITNKNVYVCYLKEYNMLTKENIMLYKGIYNIELANDFLTNNKNKILDIKNFDMFNNSFEL
jgi:hypothetical protein